MGLRDLWRLWCYRLCHLPNPHGDPPGKTKPPKETDVEISGTLNLTGVPAVPTEIMVDLGTVNLTGIPPVPPLPDDIKIHIPRNITVHHRFDTPLRIILEQSPPKLSRISLTLTSP